MLAWWAAYSGNACGSHLCNHPKKGACAAGAAWAMARNGQAREPGCFSGNPYREAIMEYLAACEKGLLRKAVKCHSRAVRIAPQDRNLLATIKLREFRKLLGRVFGEGNIETLPPAIEPAPKFKPLFARGIKVVDLHLQIGAVELLIEQKEATFNGLGAAMFEGLSVWKPGKPHGRLVVIASGGFESREVYEAYRKILLTLYCGLAEILDLDLMADEDGRVMTEFLERVKKASGNLDLILPK